MPAPDSLNVFVNSAYSSHRVLCLLLSYSVLVRASCVCLGIEVQDLFGSLGSASDRSLLRYATDSSGRVKKDKGILRLSNRPEEMIEHVGEGCNVFGTMSIESVPGNFHVTTSNTYHTMHQSTLSTQCSILVADLLAGLLVYCRSFVHQFLPALSYQHLATFYPEQFINTSHHIHYLYFGDMTRKQVKHEHLHIVMDSIHDHERIVIDDDSANAQEKHLTQTATRAAGTGPPPPSQHHFSKSFEYYLKIVHTQYSPTSRHTFHTYQYTSHGNDLVIPRQLPAIFFRYDFSPVTVKIDRRRRGFAHFLTDVCAVVGGVLTVLRIVQSVWRMRSGSGESGGGGGGSGGSVAGSTLNERSVAAPVAALPSSHAPAVHHNGYGNGGGGNGSYGGQAATVAFDSKPLVSPTISSRPSSYPAAAAPLPSTSPYQQQYGAQGSGQDVHYQQQQQQQQVMYQQQNGGSAGVQRQQVGAAQTRRAYGVGHDD